MRIEDVEYRNPLMYYIFLTYSYFGEEEGGVDVIAGGSGGGAAVMASGARGTDRLREGTGLSAGYRSEWGDRGCERSSRHGQASRR